MARLDTLSDLLDNHDVLRMKRDAIPTSDYWNWGMAEANRAQAEAMVVQEVRRLLTE